MELTEQAANWIQKKLEKLDVKVILNEQAVEENGKMTLKSGKVIEAQQVVFTTGLAPVNDFLKPEFAEALNEKGWIEADEYFRVLGGKGKLFTIGDCTTFLPNAGYQIIDSVKTIGKNLKVTVDALAKGGEVPAESELTKGAKHSQVTLCTVGPRDGVFYTPAFHTQWVLPFLKNKTMFFFRLKLPHVIRYIVILMHFSCY